MHAERIGSILVQRGTLTESQVKQVLARQRRDERPFGQLAEAMFRIPLSEIAEALADQILADSPSIKLVDERLDEACLGVIAAADAWEALVLPMRIEAGQLLCATTVETLPNAIELVQRSVSTPFRFAIVDIRLLEQFIAERYGFEGIEVDEPATFIPAASRSVA